MLSWVRLQRCTANTIIRLVIESPQCQHMIWHHISLFFFLCFQSSSCQEQFPYGPILHAMRVLSIFSPKLCYVGEYYWRTRRVFLIVQEEKIALCFCWVFDTCNSLFPGYWHFIGNCCTVLWKQGTYAKPFKNCKRRKQLELLSHAVFMLTSHALQGWQKFQQTLYCSRLIKLTYAAHVSEYRFLYVVQHENLMLKIMILCASHLFCLELMYSEEPHIQILQFLWNVWWLHTLFVQ